MIGFRVEVYSGEDKVAEVRTPAMAYALLPMVTDAKVTSCGKVLYNAKTDGPVTTINEWAAIVSPRYNDARFGKMQEVPR